MQNVKKRHGKTGAPLALDRLVHFTVMCRASIRLSDDNILSMPAGIFPRDTVA